VNTLSQALQAAPLLQTAWAVCAERRVPAWLVGGAIRDALLGRVIHDYDVVVDRDAIAIAREAAARLNAPMYILDAERDTARIVVRDAQGRRTYLDIARLRAANLESDLADRDFTINAIAIDRDAPDALIDPFGGQRDASIRSVRMLGERSLQNDPVRMLRAVRLSASLAFEIEGNTAARIRELAPRVLHASAERIRDELVHIVEHAGAYAHLQQLDQLGLLAVLLPEVTAMRDVSQSPPHHWDVFDHTLRVLDALERMLAQAAGFGEQAWDHASQAGTPMWAWAQVDRALGSFRDSLHKHFSETLSDERARWSILKWAALMHDTGKPSTRGIDASGRTRFFGHEAVGEALVGARLQALRFSANEVKHAAAIVRHHMRLLQLPQETITRRAVYRFFRDTQPAGVDVALHMLADHLATHGPDLDRERWRLRVEMARTLLEEYFARKEETIEPPPLLSGHDVMSELGVSPGPHIGRWLEALREAQAAGEISTREEALALLRQLQNEER
jgi:tRNA nucleotidyltransferase/poly(A) polymerase